MAYKPTLRLRLLLALYSGGTGFIIFEVISVALAAVLPDQYFCYYEPLTTRTMIIVSCFSTTNFLLTPHFFTEQAYKLKRAVMGGAVSYALALAVIMIILSQPQFAKAFLVPEKHSLLTILLAKHGVFLSSPFSPTPINTLTEDFAFLVSYFLVSFLISGIFGALVSWPLYRYVYQNNNGQAYWR